MSVVALGALVAVARFLPVFPDTHCLVVETRPTVAPAVPLHGDVYVFVLGGHDNQGNTGVVDLTLT